MVKTIPRLVFATQRWNHPGDQMAFKDFPDQAQGVALLQRSLERGRLGHAYLFTGDRIEDLETMARTLAKVLNCQNPVRKNGKPVDCCDQCLGCRKVEDGNHADVFWVRPESKSRLIKIGQITRRTGSPPRVLLDIVNLKPTESEFKIAVVVAADRMNTEASNAFLKTLEEPPPNSVIILLSAQPGRILETIVSRCLRLNFGGDASARFDAPLLEWLGKFSDLAATERKSLLGRYQLLDALLQRLAQMKEQVEETLTSQSPLQRYEDADKELREQWEEELKASVEAEYRRQRADLLLAVHWWLRDVWLQTLRADGGLLNFPTLSGGARLAGRLDSRQALENLQVMEGTQRLLYTNVQEALALEVGLLKLNL